MTAVFFDTNVILDLANAGRESHYESLKSVETARSRGFKLLTSSLSFCTADYVISKADGKQKAREILRKLRIVFSVAAVDHKCIDLALGSLFSDFEDAVQYYAAVSACASAIVTNDRKGFKNSAIDVMSPSEFIAVFSEPPDELNEKKLSYGKRKRVKKK